MLCIQIVRQQEKTLGVYDMHDSRVPCTVACAKSFASTLRSIAWASVPGDSLVFCMCLVFLCTISGGRLQDQQVLIANYSWRSARVHATCGVGLGLGTHSRMLRPYSS